MSIQISKSDARKLRQDHQIVQNLTGGRIGSKRGIRSNRRAIGYRGPFATNATLTDADAPAVSIVGGRFDLAQSSLEITAEDALEVEISAATTLYLYADVYNVVTVGSESLDYEWKTSPNRPTVRLVDYDGNQRYTYPLIVAELTTSDTAITDVLQLQYGDHRAAGVLQ